MKELAVPSSAEAYANPPITIERATPEDAVEIADIRQRTWLATYPNEALGITEEVVRLQLEGANGEKRARGLELLRQRLANPAPDQATFVARVDGRILGFTSPHIPKGERRIGSLYVLPEAQGMGIGWQLLQQNVDWHHAQDPTAPIHLHVASYNEKAIRFYEKFGFEATDKDIADELAKLPNGVAIPEIEMVLDPATKRA